MAEAGAKRRRSRAYAAIVAIGRQLNRLFENYAAYASRRAQRHRLARLDDRMLKDIGISRYDAMREANRRFWE